MWKTHIIKMLCNSKKNKTTNKTYVKIFQNAIDTYLDICMGHPGRHILETKRNKMLFK